MPISFLFFLKKKKEVGERKKKKQVRQAPACIEYGNILRKQDILMIPGDERTRYTVSSKASSKIRSKSTSEFYRT